jgi:hypothetical protein
MRTPAASKFFSKHRIDENHSAGGRNTSLSDNLLGKTPSKIGSSNDAFSANEETSEGLHFTEQYLGLKFTKDDHLLLKIRACTPRAR